MSRATVAVHGLSGEIREGNSYYEDPRIRCRQGARRPGRWRTDGCNRADGSQSRAVGQHLLCDEISGAVECASFYFKTPGRNQRTLALKLRAMQQQVTRADWRGEISSRSPAEQLQLKALLGISKGGGSQSFPALTADDRRCYVRRITIRRADGSFAPSTS